MSSESYPTKKDLDKLWSECIKARAGYKSEWSGKRDRLNSHHIFKKTSYRLRWELQNGVCITSGEHKFLAHGNQEAEFLFWAMRLRGLSETHLMLWKHKSTKTVDLWAVREHLKQKLGEFRDG